MQFVISSLLLLVLAGCTAPATIATPSSALAPSVPASPAFRPTPAPTRVAPTPTPGLASPTEVWAPPTAATPRRVCTPLAEHPLDELASILTNPYVAPQPGRDDGHHGADFSYYRHGERDTIEGVRVQALLEGVVAAAIHDRIPYGNMVIVETPPEQLPQAFLARLPSEGGFSLYTLYAHLSAPPVNLPGEEVACGQMLGAVGNSGWSGNPHLHLEMRLGPSGQTFQGMAFYDTRAQEDEMEAYRTWRMSGEFRSLDPMELIGVYLETNP